MNRRLRELFDAKYIDHPKVQMFLLAYTDNRPMVFALSNEGAELFSNHFQLALPNIYWAETNRRVKEKFIGYKLGFADFTVRLEVVCCEAGNVRRFTLGELTNVSCGEAELRHLTLMSISALGRKYQCGK